MTRFIPRLTQSILLVAGLAYTSAAWAGLQDDPAPDNDEPTAVYTLSIEGDCPGTVTIRWSGASANKRHGIIVGNSEGRTSIPAGQPCSGTVLGLRGSLRLIDPPGFFSTGHGAGSIKGTLKAGMCGRFLQLLEGVSCLTSNVAQIPVQAPDSSITNRESS